MVRKEMLMVSLMAGGYPIDGKPKEHHNLPSGKMIVGFVAALIIVAAIAIFATQTPAKTSQDAQTEVKTPEVQPAENAVVNAATGFAVIDWQKKLETDKNDPILGRRIREDLTPRGEILIPINAIPKEIKLYPQELNVYIVGLTINSEGTPSGKIVNRGSNTVKISDGSFLLVMPDYKWIAGGSIREIDGIDLKATTTIKSGEEKIFTGRHSPYSQSERAEAVFISPPVVSKT